MRLSVLLTLGIFLTAPVLAQTESYNVYVRESETVEELVKEALLARGEGRFANALLLLQKAEKLDPQNLDVQFYIGLTFYNLADFDSSEKTLRTILKLEPKYVDAKIILGRVLIAKGQFQESETLLRQAILQTPDYIDAYDALASNFAAQNRFSEGLRALEEGLLRSPDDVQLLVKKAKLQFYSKKLNEAEFTANRLIFLSSPIAKYQGLVLKAKILVERNPTRTTMAKELLQRAIDLNAEDSEAHLVLADLHISVWDFREAERVLQEALTVSPERQKLEVKLTEINELEKNVDRFEMAVSVSSWKFDDQRAGWQEFYLDGVWRIDPFKTLVFGLENFTRDDVSDQTLRVEYSQKLNKWIYAYVAGRATINADFREQNGIKAGTSFVTNPLKVGSTVVSIEGEGRFYEANKVYFVSAGVEQYIGKSFIINAKIFRVLSDGKDFNVWNTKVTWNATERFQLSGGYGTMTEDVSGRLVNGHSYNLGGQYRVNNRFSVVGNYTRHSNDLYKADQYTLGIKIKFKNKRKE